MLSVNKNNNMDCLQWKSKNNNNMKQTIRSKRILHRRHEVHTQNKNLKIVNNLFVFMNTLVSYLIVSLYMKPATTNNKNKNNTIVCTCVRYKLQI